MKTPDQQLTEWACNEIRFYMMDGDGVTRLYTRDAWVMLVNAFYDFCFENRAHEGSERISANNEAKTRINEVVRKYRAVFKGDPDKQRLVSKLFREIFQPRNMLRYTGIDELTIELGQRFDAMVVEAAALGLGYTEGMAKALGDKVKASGA